VCRHISRNGNEFKSLPALAESLPAEFRARSAILDGEIVALDRHGKTQFRYLLYGIGLLRYIQDATVMVSTAPRTIHDFGGFPRKPASVQEFLLDGQNA
jgi:hypothetical protein